MGMVPFGAAQRLAIREGFPGAVVNGSRGVVVFGEGYPRAEVRLWRDGGLVRWEAGVSYALEVGGLGWEASGNGSFGPGGGLASGREAYSAAVAGWGRYVAGTHRVAGHPGVGRGTAGDGVRKGKGGSRMTRKGLIGAIAAWAAGAGEGEYVLEYRIPCGATCVYGFRGGGGTDAEEALGRYVPRRYRGVPVYRVSRADGGASRDFAPGGTEGTSVP